MKMNRMGMAVWGHFTAWLGSLDPMRLLVLGYLSYVVMGWGLLLLPWMQRPEAAASGLDHLFTAVSAVSTTGLVTVSTVDTYNGWGQLVVAALIQFGGLGYMTLGSFVVLAVSGDLSPLRRRVGASVLGLPPDFDLPSFLRAVVGFTAVIETVGAILLYPRFVATGAEHPVWMAVFHSISAFCTAGFGLYNNSFENFRADGWLNAVILVLSLLGAIGFLVMADAWRWVTGRSRSMTLTSKIILAGTLWIGVGATVLFIVEEPAVHALPPGEAWMASAFQVLSASTTVGFNTLPIGALSSASVFLLTLVMLVGASPAGTGGGLKTTTFTALWSVMVTVLRGGERVRFAGKEIPATRIRAATASLFFYLMVFAAGTYALAWAESAPLPDICFECASALGTVGLSRGITSGLGDTGKWIVTLLMFVGRAGPLVIGMAILWKARSDEPAEVEDLIL